MVVVPTEVQRLVKYVQILEQAFCGVPISRIIPCFPDVPLVTQTKIAL